MTKISIDDVRSLAQLSALHLDDQEAVTLTTDLEHILQHFELLGELNTDGVQPTYYGMDLQNVSRSDEVNQPLSREQLITLSEGGVTASQVKVPKVL